MHLRFASKVFLFALAGTLTLATAGLAQDGNNGNTHGGGGAAGTAATPIILVTPAQLDFGCVEVAGSVVLDVVLSNDAADAASILEVTIIEIVPPPPGPESQDDVSLGTVYSFVPPILPTALPGDGTTLTIPVTFTPPTPDDFNGWVLRFTAPDAIDSPFEVVLNGSGSTPPDCDANGPYAGNVGDTISFDGTGSADDGTIVAYDWNFGDGNTDSGATPTHVYNVAGTYTVTLVVVDDCGLSSTCATTATIDPGNLPPNCDAGGPYAADAPATINFDGSGSVDTDGSIVAWDWDFGDGTTGAGETTSHDYPTPGVFTATLCVTDDDGAVSCCPAEVTISDPGGNVDPICDANGPYSGNQGDTITFDASGSSDPDGSIVSYDWQFGDGSTGTGVGPTHVYDDGDYTVTLCVTDDGGAQVCCETTATITNTGPVCDADGPYTGETGDTITFDGSGSADADGWIAAYDWDFGDGNTGTGVSATHAYADNGVYTVTLCVTDDDGAVSCCTSTATITNRAPLCDANGPYSGTLNETITFDGTGSADVDGSVATWDWDFGDGNTGSGETATHVYTQTGDFTITLCVTDDDAATSCCESTAMIIPPTAVELASLDATTYDGQVTIVWSTSFESDNLGFNIHRQAADGERAQVNDTRIEPRDDGDYAFVDGTATPGNTYDYTLEAVDRSGDTQTFGPMPVTVARVLPKHAALHPNRPNPFNPSTTIAFDVASAGDVSVVIFDVAGRPVRTLVRGVFEADTHSVDWDGTSDAGERLSSGIYFVQLHVAGESMTRKIVMMK